jgi:hypothetical protein
MPEDGVTFTTGPASTRTASTCADITGRDDKESPTLESVAAPAGATAKVIAAMAAAAETDRKIRGRVKCIPDGLAAQRLEPLVARALRPP